MISSIRIRSRGQSASAASDPGGVLERKIRERCDGVAFSDDGASTIVLEIEPRVGAEGFEIAYLPEGAGVRITGHDEHGLLYGVGKFLRTSRYDDGTFSPSNWRGISVPDCRVRGMYFALHKNWYSYAPRAELYAYMEELALWGLNALVFHLTPVEDHQSVASCEDRDAHRALLREAKRLGFRVGLLASANIGLPSTAPPEILAPEVPDANPIRRGNFGARVCPSKPAGFAYLSKILGEYLGGYDDIGLDYVVSFPYDSGGCGCPDCWPWGCRGYVTISKEFSRLARVRHPNAKFVLATWCFDVREESDGERAGLSRELAEDRSWVDYVMDDGHGDFPREFLDRGAPGGLPIINFAEISMWGRFPWGGSGANPLPARLQRIWDQSGHALDGGFPYSEGKYEDLNKFILSRFFWDRGAKAEDAVREYVAYEFSPDVVDEVTEAIYLLERTLPRSTQKRDDVVRAYELIQHADAKLPPRARESWRWRILYLRSVIDYELSRDDRAVTDAPRAAIDHHACVRDNTFCMSNVNDRCDEAYEELIRISHLQRGLPLLTPPSRAYLAGYDKSLPVTAV